GKALRAGGAPAGSEQEHRVVHVPWGLDHLHLHRLHLLAPHPLHLRLHLRHGLDSRQLGHFVITYHFFHWKKGTPFADDKGMYNRLTWWEQMDNGKQLTRNRKFLVVAPVVL
uniref:Uncharacterized protein n=1 Tax=Aegilops tauschii subsp. strangulata TaxID=200361 RepID=A0A453R666_AEGTS